MDEILLSPRGHVNQVGEVCPMEVCPDFWATVIPRDRVPQSRLESLSQGRIRNQSFEFAEFLEDFEGGPVFLSEGSDDCL